MVTEQFVVVTTKIAGEQFVRLAFVERCAGLPCLHGNALTQSRTLVCGLVATP